MAPAPARTADVRVAEVQTSAEIGICRARLEQVRATLANVEASARPGIVAALASPVLVGGLGIANESSLDALDDLDDQLELLIHRVERMQIAWTQHQARVAQLTEVNAGAGLADAAGLAEATLAADAARVEKDLQSLGGVRGIVGVADRIEAKVDAIAGRGAMRAGAVTKDAAAVATGGLVDADGVVDNAVDLAKYEGGYSIGAVLGAKQAIADIFGGAVDTIRLAGEYLREYFSGQLYGDILHVCEVIADAIPQVPDLAAALGAALADKWRRMGAYDRGVMIGEVGGYIGANVILALASSGQTIGIEIAQLASDGSRLAKLVQAFVKVANLAGKVNPLEIIHAPKVSEAALAKLAGLRRGAQAAERAAERTAQRAAERAAVEHGLEHGAFGPPRAAGVASRTAEELAALDARLPAELRGRLVPNPDITGARVTYGDGVHIEIGPDAGAREIDWHVPTARMLMRYEGPLGRIRRLLSKIAHVIGLSEAAYGTRGFEARAEIVKLRAIQRELEATQQRLASDVAALASAQGRADAAKLEAELASISEQLDVHGEFVDSVEPARGFVAARDIPELPIARTSIRTSVEETSTEFAVAFEGVTFDKRRTHMGAIHQPLDPVGNPVGSFEMELNSTVYVGSNEHKVSIYEHVDEDGHGLPLPSGDRIPLTRLAIEQFEALFERRFGQLPAETGGMLVMENLFNFQREYAIGIAANLGEKEAAQRAIRETSFGRHRVAAGYTEFKVDPGKLDPVDLGPDLGTQRVPSTVYARARRP